MEEGDTIRICVGVLEGTLLGNVNLTLTANVEQFVRKRQTGKSGPAQCMCVCFKLLLYTLEH